MKKLSDNQHPQTGNLEDVFREQFAQAEAEPRVSLWDRIEQDLDSGQVQVYKKRTAIYQRLAAACAALLLMFGAYAFYQELTDAPSSSPVKKEQPVVNEAQPVQPESADLPAATESQQNGADPASADQDQPQNAAVSNSAKNGPTAAVAAVTEEKFGTEQQTEPLAEPTTATPATTVPSDALSSESPESADSEKEAHPAITVNRSPMKVTVDAPNKVALGRTVTVRNVPCATGLYGGLWLQLDNDQYLKPVENTAGRKLKEGSRYQLDYELLTSAGSSEASADCRSEVPAATPVKITRIKAL